jgi:hypothetical protein
VLSDAAASVRRSFVASGERRFEEKVARESADAIRSKNRFWRAAMRREAGERENLFIAKNRDSESAQRVFSQPR